MENKQYTVSLMYVFEKQQEPFGLVQFKTENTEKSVLNAVKVNFSDKESVIALMQAAQTLQERFTYAKTAKETKVFTKESIRTFNIIKKLAITPPVFKNMGTKTIHEAIRAANVLTDDILLVFNHNEWTVISAGVEHTPLQKVIDFMNVGNRHYNFVKMTEYRNNKYYPDYNMLLAQATTEKERQYILRVQEQSAAKDIEFAYNTVAIVKNKCGHYEILQFHTWGTLSVYYNLDSIYKHSKENKCTRCICNWEKPVKK